LKERGGTRAKSVHPQWEEPAQGGLTGGRKALPGPDFALKRVVKKEGDSRCNVQREWSCKMMLWCSSTQSSGRKRGYFSGGRGYLTCLKGSKVSECMEGLQGPTRRTQAAFKVSTEWAARKNIDSRKNGGHIVEIKGKKEEAK